MLKCDYQINAILDCIAIYSDTDRDLKLKSKDVKRLHDYINTQNEKIKQLSKLSLMIDNKSTSIKLTSMTKEVEEIDL